MKSKIAMRNSLVLDVCLMNILVTDKNGIQKQLQKFVCMLNNGKVIPWDSESVYLTCADCQKEKVVTNLQQLKRYAHNVEFRCDSCRSLGSRNSFFGKVHKQTAKELIGRRNKGKTRTEEFKQMVSRHSVKFWTDEKRKKHSDRMSGSLNPFFGKRHSEDIQEKIKQKNIQYYKNHPEEIIKRREYTLNQMLNRKFRKTQPEIEVEQYLRRNGVSAKYNFILRKTYQYDFIILGTNVLIEVHGDYFHANPSKYGESKRQLNEMQKKKIEIDKKKKLFAEEFGFEVLYIWEEQVKNGDFSSLSKIVEKNNEIRTC
jgi:G:T-mismatch repair DNA endonuclease (very short patch repair protein)